MRTQAISLALAIVLLCSFACAQWIQTNGHYSRTTQCLAASGTNLFAGTEGGIFLSTDNGTNWTGAGADIVARAFAVLGTNLFVGTREGVWLSTDNGTSWKAVNRGLTDSAINALAISGVSIFAGTDSGVFLSTDGGTRWTVANKGLTNSHVNTLAVNGTDLLAGTWSGVFLSTDNGTSWTAAGLRDTLVYVLAVSPSGAGSTNLFAGIQYQRAGFVYVSTNNGKSWTKLTAPFSFFTGMAQIDSSLFAGTGSGVYLSTNHGTSWTIVDSGLTFSNVSSLVALGTNLFAGGGNGVYRSTNFGVLWTNVITSLTNKNITALAVNSSKAGGLSLFAATDNEIGQFSGVFLSTNDGMSWMTVNTGLTNTSVNALAVAGTKLFAGTWGGVFLSTNDGATWTAAGLANVEVRALAVKTNGGGDTQLFAGTNGKGVFLSTNSGGSWIAGSSGLPVGYNTWADAFVVKGPSVFVGHYGDAGGIFLRTEGDTIWRSASVGLQNPNILALATNGTELFAGATGTLYLSTNNGASWCTADDGLSNVWIRTIAIVGTSIFAGGDDGVFLSTNNATSWTSVSWGLMNPLVLALSAKGSNLFAGTYGGGVYRRPLSELITSAPTLLNVLPREFSLEQNYPNPFNPGTTIKFELPRTSQVTLTAFDILGRLVSVLINERRDAGVYEVNFDGSNLASGVYFYRLQAGNFVATKRLLLLK